MASKPTTATQRLKQDYLRIRRDPVPYVTAHPQHSNILEWHYVVRGPEGTPYEDGIYHGKLCFPSDFPFKPPSIYMLTPSGRFKTNTRLCLSISDYHPDTWNPAWSVSTILTGLLSFMCDKSPTMGSIESSDHERRSLALASGEFNLKNKTFKELFPEMVKEIQEKTRQRQATFTESVSGRVQDLVNLGAGLGSRPGAMGGGGGPVGGTGNAAADGESPFSSTLVNLVVVVGFVAFMFTVRYVLNTISTMDVDGSQ